MRDIVRVTVCLGFIGFLLEGCTRKAVTIPTYRGASEEVLVIRSISDDLKKEGADKAASDLIAFLKYFSESDVELSRDEFLVIIDQMNASFKDQQPNLLSILARIDLINASNGDVVLSLKDEETIKLDKIRIYEGATLSYADNKIVVKEGMDVGLGFIRWDLEKIHITPGNGDMEFYFNDKSQVVNLREDILE